MAEKQPLSVDEIEAQLAAQLPDRELPYWPNVWAGGMNIWHPDFEVFNGNGCTMRYDTDAFWNFNQSVDVFCATAAAQTVVGSTTMP